MVNPLSTTATEPASQPVAGRIWDNVLNALEPTFRETGGRNWLILLGVIVAGFLIGQVLNKLLDALCGRERRRGRPIRAAIFNAGSGPLSLFCVVAALGIGGGLIAMSNEVHAFTWRVFILLNVIVVGWYLFNAIEVIDLVLRRTIASHGRPTTTVQIVPLVRRSLRLFLMIILALFTAEVVFGGDVSNWLAGLGIAGLAVTLAAQDSIKNLFGSITVLLDRPFAIGDYIVIDGYEGTVEEVGFRSTRLRRNEGSIVTIPNSKAVEQSISNFSRRENIRRTLDILVPYDTPIEKLRSMREEVCRVLTAADLSQGLANGYEPQVRFVEQKVDSLYFRVIYWFASSDRRKFYEHAEHVNFGLLEYFKAAELNAKMMDVDVMMGKR